MSNPHTALISGASVAGPTLAHWLATSGWEVTIVERSRDVRAGGYPIDVRGAAAEVAVRMGVYDEIKAAEQPGRTSHIISPGGRQIATISISDVIANVSTVDVELARGDLTRILYDLTKDRVEYIFGDSVATLCEHDDRVDVTFVVGEPRSFDLVIGADGIHSTTRRLVFGPEEKFIKHLGPCVCICTTNADVGELDHGYMYTRPGRSMSFSRGADGRSRMFMPFIVEDPGAVDVNDEKAMVKLIRAAYAGDKWLVPDLLKSLEDVQDVYFDTVSQIRMDTWHTGRIGLVGDSAYAPSFLSGQGTSMAMLGAYVLATELVAADEIRQGLASYDRLMRPFVDTNQALALRKGSNVMPRDAASLRKRNLKFMTVPWLKRFGLMKLISNDVREASNDFALDTYGLRS